jgi:hypothetical protein
MERTMPLPGAAGLHLLGWPMLRCWPWLLVAISFAVNFFIIALAPEDVQATFWTGGISTIYIGSFVSFVIVMTQWLPFALGLSMTRARFYGSTALVAAGQSAIFALALAFLLGVERATDGWGVGLRFFGPTGITADSTAAQSVVYAVTLLAFSFWGMVWALVYRRWGQAGLLAAAVGGGLVVGLGVVILTRPGVWGSVVEWHAGRPQLVPLLLWPLVAGLAAAGLGWGLIRRATP